MVKMFRRFARDFRAEWIAGLAGSIVLLVVTWRFGLVELAAVTAFMGGAAIIVVLRPCAAPLIGVIAPLTPLISINSLISLSIIGLQVLAVVVTWASTAGRRGPFWLMMTFLLFLMLFGVLGATTGAQGGESVAAVYSVAVALAAWSVFMSIRLLLTSLALVGATVSLMTIIERPFEFGRAASLLGENANGIGFVAAIGLVASLTLVPGHKRRRGLLLVLPCTATCLWALLDSGSRGAFISALAGVLVLSWVLLRQSRPALAIWVLPLGIALLWTFWGGLLAWYQNTVGRGAIDTQTSNEARLAAASNAIDWGLESPVFGTGLGALSSVARLDSMGSVSIRAHNVYLTVFAEAGIAAALTLLAIVVLSLAKSARHAPAGLLPLVCAVIASGVTLDWITSSRTGPFACLVLGATLGLHQVKAVSPSRASPAVVRIRPITQASPATPLDLQRDS